MREADNALFERGRLIVDTRGAFAESGDLIEPVSAGILDAESVHDLATMIKDKTLHRRNEQEITIFKAVGTAISDLATAEYLLQRYATLATKAPDGV
jgi:ornithine cyclodeaminase